QYHQEGPAEEGPYERYTNLALEKCRVDDVPVGVVLPAPEVSTSSYRVMGLGFIDYYRDGYFVISGPAEVSGVGFDLGAPSPQTLELISFAAEDTAEYAGVGVKQRTLASVVQRQGQPHFRRQLLTAYEGRCAMSEYDAEDALEAAHVEPYSGPQSNTVGNGLLLRADLHDLFDLGLVAVDTSRQALLLSEKLAGTKYEHFEGRRLHLPEGRHLWPQAERLDRHRQLAGL
ncbi:MAG: HNH endonuclease, partial [Coriobacteriia bacterium]|nr:HNH endonuclease [Coriobacteriia bacterium]